MATRLPTTTTTTQPGQQANQDPLVERILIVVAQEQVDHHHGPEGAAGGGLGENQVPLPRGESQLRPPDRDGFSTGPDLVPEHEEQG